MRTQAISRLLLDNIHSIGSSWVTMGPTIGQLGLYFGANDMQNGTKTMQNAAKLDKYLSGITAPTADKAWRYLYTYGRTPLLAPPTQ